MKLWGTYFFQSSFLLLIASGETTIIKNKKDQSIVHKQEFVIFNLTRNLKNANISIFEFLDSSFYDNFAIIEHHYHILWTESIVFLHNAMFFTMRKIHLKVSSYLQESGINEQPIKNNHNALHYFPFFRRYARNINKRLEDIKKAEMRFLIEKTHTLERNFVICVKELIRNTAIRVASPKKIQFKKAEDELKNLFLEYQTYNYQLQGLKNEKYRIHTEQSCFDVKYSDNTRSECFMSNYRIAKEGESKIGDVESKLDKILSAHRTSMKLYFTKAKSTLERQILTNLLVFLCYFQKKYLAESGVFNRA